MGRSIKDALADAGAIAGELPAGEGADAPEAAVALADPVAPEGEAEDADPFNENPHAPERKRRDVSAQAQAATDPKERYALAPALDESAGVWHATPDGGEVAITRHTSGEGEGAKVRDFLTYLPPRGRVQSIPLYAVDAHPEIEL